MTHLVAFALNLTDEMCFYLIQVEGYNETVSCYRSEYLHVVCCASKSKTTNSNKMQFTTRISQKKISTVIQFCVLVLTSSIIKPLFIENIS